MMRDRIFEIRVYYYQWLIYVGFAGGGAGQRGVRVLCQISVGGLPDRVYR